MPRPSQRSAVPAFEVMAILDRLGAMRAAGRDVISLCAGEPTGGAPTDVRERAAKALKDGADLGYTPALGLPQLREAIAGHHGRWYGVEVDPASVAVTTGASGAFVLHFLAAFDAGDRVLVTRPGYPAYRNLLQALGIEVVELPVTAETAFRPTVAALEAAVSAGGPIRGLVFASPANPTGAMVDRSTLGELARWCQDHGALLISDEIYHGITYPADPAAADARGVSAAALDPAAVVVSSFSKYWGMTGWRLGWAIVPDHLRDAVDALAGNAALCPPTLAQVAALEAFTERSYAEADDRVEQLARARGLLLGAVGRLGWGPTAPVDGAFYLWAELGAGRDSTAWCRVLLDATGVAIVPGTDADTADGHRFVRVSFSAGPTAVAAAIERIEAFEATSAAPRPI